MTYAEWVNRHCETFGLFDEQEVAMVLSWQGPLCEIAGFTIAELIDATNWMASQAAPRYRTEHLRLIQEKISGDRLLQAARENQQRLAELMSEDHGTCVLCLNSGVVVVPHLTCILNGAWVRPWRTLGVLCRCGLGRHYASTDRRLDEANRDEARRKNRPEPNSRIRMGIDEYERTNPLWQGQVEEKKQQQLILYQAESAAGEADKRRGPLERTINEAVGKIKARQG